MALPQITTTITPPLPSDTPAVFNARAYAAWAALADLSPEINSWSIEVDSIATAINANKTAAQTAATTAAGAATTASSAATTATTKASEAGTSATNAAASATTATTKASEASTSATNASNSAATATTKASEAATSATNASNSATTATGAATTATTKAGEASTSATNAAASATAAAASATTAATKASEAATSATNLASAVTAAAGSATAAAASATSASNSADAAAQAAQDAQDAAEQAAGGGEPTILAGTTSDYWRGDKTWQRLSDAVAAAPAVAAKINASEKGAANGVATLGADQKIPESQLPAVAVTDTFEVASQSAMLALTAERGDVAVRSDLNKTYILKAEPASTLANWVELRTPTDAVLSVAGKTGAVSLVKGDVGLGNVDNTSDASKPVSTATQAALDGKEPAITKSTGYAKWTGSAWSFVNETYLQSGDAGKTLSGLTLTGTSTATVVKFASEYNAGNSGTATTISFSNGQKQKLTLTGNATITLSFPGPGNYQLKLVQDGIGNRTVAWNGTPKYLGSASAPAINATASGETIVSIYYDGTSYYLAASKVGA